MSRLEDLLTSALKLLLSLNNISSKELFFVKYSNVFLTGGKPKLN